MTDEDLLDLDTLTDLLTEDDFTESCAPVLESTNKKITVNSSKGTEELENELLQMREQMKLLEEELRKKSQPSQDIPPQESKGKLQLIDHNIFMPVSSPESTPVKSIVKCKDGVKQVKKFSLVHNGDTDSSDDEEKRNNKVSTLTASGKAIKKRLEQYTRSNYEVPYHKQEKKAWKSNSQVFPRLKPVASITASTAKSEELQTDSYSGLRISNPLVSSSALSIRMAGRKMIRMSIIQSQIRNGDIEGDWVTIGVIIQKSEPKTSKNGKTFSIWKMNDLRDLNSSLSLFLFGEVHKELWKTSVGSVLGLLNAKIMPNREGDKKGEICLTIDQAGKVMMIGMSKDFGTCKGRRRDGAACGNLVNRLQCEYCEYHVKAEYKKYTGKRMELQATYSGVEPKCWKNPGMKSKILSKNGIMYGGQLYTVPLSKSETSSKKQKDRLTLDSLKLRQLAQKIEVLEREKVNVQHLSEKENQAINEITSSSEFLGDRLTIPTAGSRNLIRHLVKEDKDVKVKSGEIVSVTPKQLLEIHSKTMQSLKRKRNDSEVKSGNSSGLKLSPGLRAGCDFELATGISSGSLDVAKLRALAKLSHKPIIREDPNAVNKRLKKSSPESSQRLLERVEGNKSSCQPNSPNSRGGSLDGVPCKDLNQSRLGGMSREAMESIMKRKSSHSYEIDQDEAEKQQKYFSVLEKKEQLELKMQEVTEITCSVISCKICKYTAQNVGERCVKENHPVKRHKAQKRFFMCLQCKHRTFAFTKLPTKNCRNCGSLKFERTSMMKMKEGPKLENEKLLLRGEEIKFIK